MRAEDRGARRRFVVGLAIVTLTVLPGSYGWAEDESDLSPEQLNAFAARYRSALGRLWGGAPLEAIDPLYQLVLDGGCLHHKCEMRLAQAYRYIGEIDEAYRWAVSAVERAERKGLGGAEEYNELGLCLFGMARRDPVHLEQAVEALRTSVDRHVGQGDTYLYNLSQVLLVSGATLEAGEILQVFQESQGLRPIIEKGEAVIGEFERLEVADRQYAKYTPEAREQGTEGQILLRAIIDAHGDVADVEVVHGLPNGLNEAALKALRKSTFRPALLNGEPVATIYHQSVDMRLTPALVSQRRISGDGHDH